MKTNRFWKDASPTTEGASYGRRWATAGAAGMLLFGGLVLIAPTSFAHYCHSDEDHPNGCDAACTPGQYHDHYIDYDYPDENYQCYSDEVVPPAAQCDDGKDNDGDGKVDGEDPGCSSTTDNWEADDDTEPKECKVGTVTVPNSFCAVTKDVCSILEKVVDKCGVIIKIETGSEETTNNN